MKKLHLQQQSFRYILQGFKDWLQLLNYSDSAQTNYPHYVQEFFYFLEQNGMLQIDRVSHEQILAYYNHLKHRHNQTRSGGLSRAYLNHHQTALKKLRVFLKRQGISGFKVPLRREKMPHEAKAVCSKQTIKALFNATDYSHEKAHFRARHKAMLVCLYSLGMRRSEVVNLQLKDIDYQNLVVLVRKAKNYKQRLIPINKYNLRILEVFIYEHRNSFESAISSPYVFVSHRAQKMVGDTFSSDLRRIIKASGLEENLEGFSLHSLRHAIATHLLQAGVAIERIQCFLGHQSLDSTQIYTQILEA